MTAARRTTKSLAARIDSDYIRRTGWLGRARRTLSVAACLGALGWLTLYGRQWGDERLYNPGPVASAHAQWEHNCAACHDAGQADSADAFDGTARFFKSVSDAACLKCHDAAVHHPNQATMISADGLKSANCAACHVEHKGEAALAAASDAHCVRCHADLGSHSKSPPAVQASVTAFLAAGGSGPPHPPFGRSLMRGGRLSDPTAVKFNHHFHFEDIAGPRMTSCTSCHSAETPNPAATRPATGGHNSPPWSSDKDRPVEWTADGDGRYMAPINYQRHCVACHEMPIISGTQIAHEDLALVRSQLAAMPSAELQSSLPGGGGGGAAGRSIPGRKPSPKPGPGGGTDGIFKSLEAAIGRKALAPDEEERATKRLQEIRKSANPAVALAEFHVAYTSNNGCAKCHQLRDAGGDGALATVPTGIPDAPRRWYVNGRFDHDAHRHVGCVDCHGQARTSRETDDVLLPDITNCASCHHADRGGVRGAPSSCVTCHLHHDRTRETDALTSFVAGAAPAGRPPTR